MEGRRYNTIAFRGICEWHKCIQNEFARERKWRVGEWIATQK